MPIYKTKQAESVFGKLNIHEGSSDHHRRGFLVDEQTGIKLFPPIYFNKGRKDIYPKISNKMRKGLKLTDHEFDELMRCHMSREVYFDLRRRRDGR